MLPSLVNESRRGIDGGLLRIVDQIGREETAAIRQRFENCALAKAP